MQSSPSGRLCLGAATRGQGSGAKRQAPVTLSDGEAAQRTCVIFPEITKLKTAELGDGPGSLSPTCHALKAARDSQGKPAQVAADRVPGTSGFAKVPPVPTPRLSGRCLAQRHQSRCSQIGCDSTWPFGFQLDMKLPDPGGSWGFQPTHSLDLRSRPPTFPGWRLPSAPGRRPAGVASLWPALPEGISEWLHWHFPTSKERWK